MSARHWRFGRRILGFLGRARRDLGRGVGSASLEEYLHDAPDDIREYFAYPLAGALWSMGRRELGGFPAEIFLGFLENHGMLRPLFPPKWRTIRGGSQVYVEALLRQTPIELHLNAAVQSVRRAADHVLLGFADGSEQRFDRVVFACHADQALALLADPSPEEQAVLGAIRFTQNDIWLHHRPRISATRRIGVGLVELSGYRPRAGCRHLLAQSPAGPPRSRNFLRDAQPCIAPRRRSGPLPDHSSGLRRARVARAENACRPSNGRRHTAFAGAYFGYGFHEDGARSAWPLPNRSDEIRPLQRHIEPRARRR